MGLPIGKKILNTTQIKNYYEEQPPGLKWRSNTIFILATVAIGLFTDLFLYGLVVPVLPFLLQGRIGVPEDQVQTYTSALLAVYAGSSVIASPIAGWFADSVATRQAPFLFALATLTVATIVLFLGETIPVLVVARILQGISSGFVWTVGLALCIETVGPENLGKAIGTMFSFISAGSLWAPFLGGLLYEKTGYIGVLGLSLGVLAVDFSMRILVIEKRVAKKYGLDETWNQNENENGDDENTEQQNGQATAHEQTPLLGGIKDDDSKFKLAKDQPRIIRAIPILPCLKNPGLLVALLVAFVQAALLGSLDATVSTVAIELFDFDSLRAGLFYLPLGLLDLICGPIFGWSVDRFGTKPAAVFSYTFLIPFLVLLRLPHAGGTDQIILYGGLLAAIGIGVSGTGAPSIVEAGAVVDRYHKANPEFFGESGPYAQLYGLNNMLFNLGLTAGPELAGELKQKIGYGNMNIVLAAVCALTAVLSFFFIGGKPKLLARP